MSEAPEFCLECPIGARMVCKAQRLDVRPDGAIYVPSESCPFVRLDHCATGIAGMLDMIESRDAEIEAQRLRIVELRECKQAEAEYLAKDAEIERLRAEHDAAALEINETVLAERQRHREELAVKDAEIERLRAELMPFCPKDRNTSECVAGADAAFTSAKPSEAAMSESCADRCPLGICACGYIREVDRLRAEIERLRACLGMMPEGRGDCAFCEHRYVSLMQEPCVSCIEPMTTGGNWQRAKALPLDNPPNNP